MRSFAQRQDQPQGPVFSSLAGSGTAMAPTDQNEPTILHLQRTIGNQAVLRRLQTDASGQYSPQNNTRQERPAHTPTRLSFPDQNFMIQGRIPPPSDPIHGPLLDQYSQESGLPRDTVTQHDPGYEEWLLGGSIHMSIDMGVPSQNPSPNYSLDENQLKAWESASLIFTVSRYSICDHVMSHGVESSFVTDVVFKFVEPKFHYFIASNIHDNMDDPSLQADEKITWRRIHARIRGHAGEHFVRYRQVVNDMRQTIEERLTALPSRRRPIQIPQQDLEEHVTKLLSYLVAKLNFQLWRTTCDWEKTDYPTLLKDIPVWGTFKPACDPQPTVPPEPMMPIVVTPGPSQTKPPARQNKP